MPAVAQPILVLHDRPEELRDLFDDTPFGSSVHYGANAGEVLEALSRVRPEIVFSIKHSGFPGPAHRPAIEAPSVRWVQVGGSGFEHFAPWDPTRVTVTNCAGVLAPFLAETILAALLMKARGLDRYRDQQRERVWRPLTTTSLRGKTLLVVGVGAIGGALATAARALGMRVLGVRRSGAPHPAIDEMHAPESLHALLGQADVVSVHLRATPESAGLFGAEAFAAMRRGATFVNTSRGALVDESAVVDALRSGQLGGAYLDVFEREPLPTESPLWALENVVLTPHSADNVEGWPRRFAEVFVDNVGRWQRGEPLRNVVVP